VATTAVVYSVSVALLLGAVIVRRRDTGRLPAPAFWLACIVAFGAVALGTIVPRIPGVPLAVPVVVFAGVVIVRGGWRLGDAGLFLVVLGIGMGVSYVGAAVLDPDTGSYADQGALVLAFLGGVLCMAAITWSVARRWRRGSREASSAT
jgi:hypothetical protein